MHSVMVEIAGPDPKLVKGKVASAFHKSVDGVTTISASGFVADSHFQWTGTTILCHATVIVPFLTPRSQHALLQAGKASLLPSSRISVTTVDGSKAECALEGFCQLPGVLEAAELMMARAAGWAWRWNLHSSPTATDNKGVGWLAILRRKAPADSKNSLNPGTWTLSPPLEQGSRVSCFGAPFGVLSTNHFSNYMTSGIVSNLLTSKEGLPALYLADMHCLPGMEGGPVLNCHGELVGILGIPLSNASFDAQVPTVIPASAIMTALKGWTPPSDAGPPPTRAIPQQPKSMPSARGKPFKPFMRIDYREAPVGVQAALMTQAQLSRGLETSATRAWAGGEQSASCRNVIGGLATSKEAVVAVVSSANAWATGVLVSHSGLVLTVAHLLHPQRGEAQLAAPSEAKSSLRICIFTKGRRLWLSAEVLYVSTSSLDVAILRLNDQLPPDAVVASLCCREPKQGEEVHVVGHALLNPSIGLRASVTSGIVSKVVCASANGAPTQPVMLITTAAVCPGASGGAVLAEDGTLLGLVTSNAKHAASGASIPRLNFSIAAPALRPMWDCIAGSDGPLDADAFRALDGRSKGLSHLWALSSPPEVLGEAAPGRKSAGEARLVELVEKYGLQQSKL